MNLEIYQEVALKKNLSKSKFKKGDLCTVLSVKEEGKKKDDRYRIFFYTR